MNVVLRSLTTTMSSHLIYIRFSVRIREIRKMNNDFLYLFLKRSSRKESPTPTRNQREMCLSKLSNHLLKSAANSSHHPPEVNLPFLLTLSPRTVSSWHMSSQLPVCLAATPHLLYASLPEPWTQSEGQSPFRTTPTLPSFRRPASNQQISLL